MHVYQGNVTWGLWNTVFATIPRLNYQIDSTITQVRSAHEWLTLYSWLWLHNATSLKLIYVTRKFRFFYNEEFLTIFYISLRYINFIWSSSYVGFTLKAMWKTNEVTIFLDKIFDTGALIIMGWSKFSRFSLCNNTYRKNLIRSLMFNKFW